MSPLPYRKVWLTIVSGRLVAASARASRARGGTAAAAAAPPSRTRRLTMVHDSSNFSCRRAPPDRPGPGRRGPFRACVRTDASPRHDGAGGSSTRLKRFTLSKFLKCSGYHVTRQCLSIDVTERSRAWKRACGGGPPAGRGPAVLDNDGGRISRVAALRRAV